MCSNALEWHETKWMLFLKGHTGSFLAFMIYDDKGGYDVRMRVWRYDCIVQCGIPNQEYTVVIYQLAA